MSKLQKYKDYKSPKTFSVVIEWEHGDADTKIKETYSFKSKEEMDEYLNFIYELRGVSKRTNPLKNTVYWFFQDDHYKREWKWVNKMHDKYDYKFEDYVPSDVHYSQYRPSINKIWVKLGNKKHYIVWLDLLHKQENAIDLPKKGDEISLDTGHVCWHHNAFKDIKQKDVVFHKDLDEFLGKSTGKYPNNTYPTFKVKVVDCVINKKILEYNYDFKSFEYEILTEIIDDRLVGKVKKYAISHRTGFDPNFNEKFNHGEYDGIPTYEIR